MSNIPEEHIWPMIDGAVIGGLGGLVNGLRQKLGNGLRQKPLREWGQIAVGVLTAAFAGMLAQLMAGWISEDIRFQFSMAGIAGYGGNALLDDVVKRVRGLLNKGADVLEDGLNAAAKIKGGKDGKS